MVLVVCQSSVYSQNLRNIFCGVSIHVQFLNFLKHYKRPVLIRYVTLVYFIRMFIQREQEPYLNQCPIFV